jgi:hypothetical protein
MQNIRPLSEETLDERDEEDEAQQERRVDSYHEERGEPNSLATRILRS